MYSWSSDCSSRIKNFHRVIQALYVPAVTTHDGAFPFQYSPNREVEFPRGKAIIPTTKCVRLTCALLFKSGCISCHVLGQWYQCVVGWVDAKWVWRSEAAHRLCILFRHPTVEDSRQIMPIEIIDRQLSSFCTEYQVIFKYVLGGANLLQRKPPMLDSVDLRVMYETQRPLSGCMIHFYWTLWRSSSKFHAQSKDVFLLIPNEWVFFPESALSMFFRGSNNVPVEDC